MTGVADRLEAVSAEGDLVLASGVTVRLAGLRLPEAPWLGGALADMRSHVGRDVQVMGRADADRWGRRPVRLLVLPGAHPVEGPADLGRRLVGAGLALVDPTEGESACRRMLMADEASARSRTLGLWAADRYTPIPVAELSRLKEQIGRFVLVEGRVRSIGERPQRTYLNFSGEWASDFTMIVPKRIWSRMVEQGLDGATLKGRFIRARGILEDRQGPALTVTAPEVIEVVEEESRRRTR